jgi:hypothetical protein
MLRLNDTQAAYLYLKLNSNESSNATFFTADPIDQYLILNQISSRSIVAPTITFALERFVKCGQGYRLGRDFSVSCFKNTSRNIQGFTMYD